MAKAIKVLRTYKVVDRNEAERLGAKTFSLSEWNKFALVAVRGDTLDNVVAWGYKSDNLEKKAQERNKDIGMLQRMVGKAAADIENDEAV